MSQTTHITNKLLGLSKQKQLTFGLLTAERFFICYEMFSEREGFGNIEHLKKSMNLIESFIIGENEDMKHIDNYKELVDKSTPDIDDFGSVNSSLALNAGAIIYEALNFIINDEQRIIKEFSTYATDTLDFLILEIEDYDSMEFERISSHKLMKEEIRIQEGIVEYLERVESLDSGDIETLRLMQKETEFSNLNLGEIFAK